jgi:ornithine cyclodeaminase/alanine dehydrogenase-like protein (mu-crystallin family)
MVCARIGSGQHVFHRLDVARIRRVQHRESVGKLVSDVQVLTIEHDLYAVEASALVAPGDVLDAIADSCEGVRAQGAEFLRAKAAGLIGDDHIVAEIGQVLAGEIEGRRTNEEITVYKSLGHIVQDLATAWALYSEAETPS